jgi:hypothetical protein
MEPVQVASSEIGDVGAHKCVSGRHRVAETLCGSARYFA